MLFPFQTELWKRVQEHGLAVPYRDNHHARRLIKKTMALRHLPLPPRRAAQLCCPVERIQYQKTYYTLLSWPSGVLELHQQHVHQPCWKLPASSLERIHMGGGWSREQITMLKVCTPTNIIYICRPILTQMHSLLLLFWNSF